MPQEKPRCPDGQIDWYAVNVLHGGKAYAKHASSFKGFKIFHQVRHPLKVIGSACTFPMPEWEYVSRLIPGIQDDPAPLRTMRYWYHWNILAEEKAEWTYTLESIPLIFPEFCKRFEVKEDQQALSRVPRNTNSRVQRRTHRKFTWADLEAADKSLAYKIKELARDYGYEVKP
jgi:hypothetical protein